VRRSWATDSTDVLDEVYTPDTLWHPPDQDIHGVEDFRQYLTTFINAFPDLNATVEDEIAEGEKVVNRFTGRGTHQGETEELGPPTGRQVVI
jgi:predicted ester cyclase